MKSDGPEFRVSIKPHQEIYDQFMDISTITGEHPRSLMRMALREFIDRRQHLLSSDENKKGQEDE